MAKVLLQRYGDFAPMPFDHHQRVNDRDDWFTLTVVKEETSDELTLSNFDAALKRLGGAKKNRVEVHKFCHWASGVSEVIFVHPSLKGKCMEIERVLDSRKPVLDQEDYSARLWGGKRWQTSA